VTTIPFTQKTYPLGAEQNFDGNKSLAIAESIEDEGLIHKLAPNRLSSASCDTEPRASSKRSD